MTWEIKPARRENVGLIIGLIGPSGSGKTKSALELATGICGDDPFCVIDTEAGRALHYAKVSPEDPDGYAFDHLDFGAPFSPDRYAEAIALADAKGYKAIVVDQMSYEHVGEGGILDMHEAEVDRMAGGDFKKRERVKRLAWVKPKQSHKRMMRSFLQIRAHLILCFRAEEKTDQVKEGGQTKIISLGFQPVCEKTVPYELTASMLFHPESPGIPDPIKIQDQHRHLFPTNRVVTVETGRAINEWAGGVPDESLLAALAMIRDMTADDMAGVGSRLKAMGLGGAALTRARRAYSTKAEQIKSEAEHANYASIGPEPWEDDNGG